MPQRFEDALQVDDETEFNGEFSFFMNDDTPDSDYYLDPLADSIKVACRDWPTIEARLPSVEGCHWAAGMVQNGRTVWCTLSLIEGNADTYPVPEALADPNRSVARISVMFEAAPLVVFISARSEQLGRQITKLLSNMLLQYRLSDARGLIGSSQ